MNCYYITYIIHNQNVGAHSYVSRSSHEHTIINLLRCSVVPSQSSCADDDLLNCSVSIFNLSSFFFSFFSLHSQRHRNLVCGIFLGANFCDRIFVGFSFLSAFNHPRQFDSGGTPSPPPNSQPPTPPPTHTHSNSHNGHNLHPCASYPPNH